MERVRMVFSGAGGQGVITAAIILAEAAVKHEGLIAVQSQSYGPEARGGGDTERCDNFQLGDSVSKSDSSQCAYLFDPGGLQ